MDVLLTTIPPNYIVEPALAPAILKSALTANGFSCQTIDFSLHCYNKVFEKDYNTYLEWGNTLVSEYDYTKITLEHQRFTDRVIDEYINLINSVRPKFLALSIFSYWQQRLGYFICQRIRELKLDVKIIIGGMGVSGIPQGIENIAKLSYFDLKNSYGMFLKQQKLVDYVIVNDGELDIVKVLQNAESYQSTFNHNEVSYDNTFYPDYDDYALDEYHYINNEKSLLVAGSKGCVRQCIFCSEHSNYSTYYFKSGTNLADEIIYLSQKYSIYKFHLTDSLVNGSLPAFKKFISRLADYNETNPEKKIKWHGNYICRANNNMSDADFKILKLSGAIGLTIGAESGSNRVLEEMKKQTTAEDLLYEISKFEQHGINCTLLFMVGFYNETWDDFLMTLSLVKKLQPYFYTGTINNLRFGYTLAIRDYQKLNYDDFTINQTNCYDWVYHKNPDLTLTERIRRRIIIQEFCDQLRIPIGYAREDLLMLDSIYNNNLVEEMSYNGHH